MKTPTIGIVVGSTRPARFAEKPVAWLRTLAAKRSDLQIQVLDLLDHPLPFFDEAGPPAATSPKGDVAQGWAKALAGVDGFIFVTPEYNHGTSAVLKNAMDYAYKEWNRKPAAFVGYGGLGGARAVHGLRVATAVLGMAPISKSVHVAMPDFHAIRSGKDMSDFVHLEQAATAMVDELLWWTLALNEARDRT